MMPNPVLTTMSSFAVRRSSIYSSNKRVAMQLKPWFDPTVCMVCVCGVPMANLYID